MRIMAAPGAVVQFCQRFLTCTFAPAHINGALPALLTAIILGRSRSYTEQAGLVVDHVRNKSAISRLYGNRAFNSRDLHWSVVRRLMAMAAPPPGQAIEWLLAFDGMCTQRGRETKIKGGNERGEEKKKPKPSRRRDSSGGRKGRKGARRRTRRQKEKRNAAARTRRTATRRRKAKGRATKYYTFLVSTLTTHQSLRIALPRYTCDPKDFHRTSGRPKAHRDTQIDLARTLLERVLRILPAGVRLVAVADAYFDSDKLFSLAQHHPDRLVFITPADANRCFGEEQSPHKSNGQRIRAHGQSLPLGSFSRLDLRRGSEGTAHFRRHDGRKPGPKDRQTIWVHHEQRTVAKLGTVGVVHSWKTPMFEPRRNFRKRSYKALLCSDPSWSGEKVAEFFGLRWTAIEIVIREWKTDLGLARNLGLNLEAMERYIDVVLLSFLCLEAWRYDLLESPGVHPHLRQAAQESRTRGMQALLWREVDLELLDVVERSYVSQRAKREVKRFLRHQRGTPFAEPCGRAAAMAAAIG